MAKYVLGNFYCEMKIFYIKSRQNANLRFSKHGGKRWHESNSFCAIKFSNYVGQKWSNYVSFPYISAYHHVFWFTYLLYSCFRRLFLHALATWKRIRLPNSTYLLEYDAAYIQSTVRCRIIQILRKIELYGLCKLSNKHLAEDKA